MKLQAALLAVGLFVSVGAVGAEMNRAAHVNSGSSAVASSVSATQASVQLPSKTSAATITLGAKPSIAGGGGEDD
jgi:hypothetical protein